MSDKSLTDRSDRPKDAAGTPTLLLSPRHTPDSIALWKAATAARWPVERLASWRLPEEFRQRDFVFYGEPLLAAAITSASAMAFLGPPENWIVGLDHTYRKREIEFSTLGEARRLTAPRFVKPAEDKSFTARVYSRGAELPAESLLPDTTAVLIAEPVSWQIEWRSFVLERQILTLCPYLRVGKLAQGEDGSWPATEWELSKAREFAESVLADPRVDFPPAVVLDVGTIADRGWAVVECNAAWGSGIYGCDANAVLRCIRRASVRKDVISAEDLRWAVGLPRVDRSPN